MQSRFTKLAAASIVLGLFAFGIGGLEVSFFERIGRAAGETARGFAVAKAAGDPAYYRDFNRVPLADGGTKSELKNPYRNSVWVAAAINACTAPIKAVTLKIYRGDVEIDEPTLAEFLKRPGQGMTREEFIDATAGWLKLRGEFFWVLDDTWLGTRASRRSPVLVARPDRMREIVVADVLLGWELTDDKGRRTALLAEQVIQVKRWNPFNRFRGLGELEAALMAAETDYLAAIYARDTYANQGDVGGVYTAKAGMPTPEQEQQIIAALRAKQAAKARGDFRPVFLSGDIELQNPQVTAPDAAFVANRLENRHEIFIAFGVPPSMANIQASYSVGSASDWFRLIIGTCMPIGRMIEGAFDQLLTRFGTNLESEFDWDEHPVMQEVRRERIEAGVKLWEKGMPWKEINDYLDLGMQPFAGWEIAYIPFSVSPVGEEAPAPEPAPAAVPAADPAADIEKSVARLRCLFDSGAKVVSKSRDERRAALVKSHERRRKSAEKAFVAKFAKVTNGAPRSEVLRKIEAAKLTTNSISRAVAADLNFNLADYRKALTAEMRKQSLAALVEAGQALFEEVGKDDVFAMAPRAALQFLAVRENRMADVAAETHAQVGRALQAGIDACDTMDELADRARQAFNGLSKGRALTVAATETAACYGVARHDAMEQAGVAYKQWLAAGDGAVRESHAATDGEIVRLEENFSNGLAFPGDPEGAAEEVINCRCVQIAVAGPTEEGIA